MERFPLFRTLTVVAWAVLVLTSSLTRADTPRKEERRDEFDRLARRLETQAREVRKDLLVPFRNAAQFRNLGERMEEIERLSVRIYEMTERDGRNRQVREVLEKLDEEFRTVDRLVDDLGKARELDRRAYDRVRDDMREMRDTISRMRREL